MQGSWSTFVPSQRGPPRRRHPHKSIRGLHPRSYSRLVYVGTEQAGRRAHGRSYPCLRSYIGRFMGSRCVFGQHYGGRSLSGEQITRQWWGKFCLGKDSGIRGVSPQSFRPSPFPRLLYSACTDFYLLYGKKIPPRMDQCVFIRGFREKRVPFWARITRAPAKPSPDKVRMPMHDCLLQLYLGMSRGYQC